MPTSNVAEKVDEIARSSRGRTHGCRSHGQVADQGTFSKAELGQG